MCQKTCFSVVGNDVKNVVFVFENEGSCLKMRGQIWGYLGQMAHRRQIAQWAGTRTAHPMAHRRQIAQWVGTRTTHPGGAGFEPWPPPCYLLERMYHLKTLCWGVGM